MMQRKKDKVVVIVIDDNSRLIGRFKAFLAWTDGRRGRLFDGREVKKFGNQWVYIAK
jgi:hypothetical protein